MNVFKQSVICDRANQCARHEGQVEVEFLILQLIHLGFDSPSGLRPLTRNVSEGQFSLCQLRAKAVHPVKHIYPGVLVGFCGNELYW